MKPPLITRMARGAAIATLGSLVLAGCGMGNPRRASMGITNDTDEPLAIAIESIAPTYTIDPGETLGFSLGGREGDCTPWTLHATTVDGLEASSVGEPVCDQDHWTIGQSELDAARAAAGTPAQSPTPSAAP